MLAVIAIIAIIMAMILPALAGARKQARFARWAGYSNDIAIHDDMVAYYTFDHVRNADSDVLLNMANGPVDSKIYIRSSLNGQYVGAAALTRGIGRWGKGATYFNGSGSYINCSYQNDNLSTLPLTDTVSIIAWVNPAVVSGDRGIVGRGGMLAFKTWGNGMRFTTPGIKDHSAGGLGLKVGEWQCVAVVFEAGGNCVFYVNGKQVSSVAASGINTTYSSLLLGNNQWNQYFNGSIDEVAVFNTALSAQRIEEFYRMGEE
jgi:hypothetical protein